MFLDKCGDDTLPALIAGHPYIALAIWLGCSIATGSFQLKDGFWAALHSRTVTWGQLAGFVICAMTPASIILCFFFFVLVLCCALTWPFEGPGRTPLFRPPNASE